MAKVRTSAYRQPPTPGGLKAMEEGSLEWFDTEMFANFNTEVLEEYLDEKNRNESFGRIEWKWHQILVGLSIGILFAIINQYVGLKVGLIVSGAWYVAYLLGLSLKWSPGELNVSAATSSGAAMICTGFVFTYPAIYLLAVSPNYAQEGGGHLIDNALLLPDSWALAGVALLASVLGGFLGVMYFIIFRRVWLVEDPLPLPGFEAYIKLADIANDVTQGSTEAAQESIKTVGIWTTIVAAFTFFRDFELFDTGRKDILGDTIRESFMDKVFGGKYYAHGEIIQPIESAHWTWVGFALTPLMAAIGWFMRFRVALLVSLGTFFTWFVVCPLAAYYDVAFFYPADGQYHTVSAWEDFGLGASLRSYSFVARPIAIGAILGGGITGLLKMAPVFKTAGADVVDIIKGGSGGDSGYIEGKGWYEWPISHILYMMVIAFSGITVIFATEFGVIPALIFSLVLILTTFALGAIAVKVMGETSIEPVSGTSFIVLLMLVIIFKYVLGLSNSEAGLLGLVGTTVFGGAISMSGNVITDFKNALYIGNRPYHILKAQLTGIVPGAIVSGLAASILSLGLAKGDLVLYAPQANAFASFAQIMLGGKTPWSLLLIGIFIGVFMELVTGMGTAFGLGMYLPLTVTLPMVVGGAARDYWQNNYLDPQLEQKLIDEREHTLKLLKTYMVATGMIVGEALMGTIVAIYLVIPLLTGG